ncbi:hypothetical protein D8674_006359 [Pyrus ussuriensis x Pyrus communis]|uniref:Uncharacterized protein n=1 Tax=Pyrus ussuriensis x Pyrus communis TaxID=2448454 RepID=A0A5N5FZR1_9ROSA|nr:hypothetical protein D8674_006359 [Pyrus ussuriensis x Pyrus communis]
MAMWMGAWRGSLLSKPARGISCHVFTFSTNFYKMGKKFCRKCVIQISEKAFTILKSCGARSLLLEAMLVIWPSHKGPMFGSMMYDFLAGCYLFQEWQRCQACGHTSRTARTSLIAPKQGDGGTATSSDLALLGAIESMIELIR